MFPNQLLSTLPPDDYQRILPDLVTVEVNPGEVLHAHDQPIRDVYFPLQGVYSIVTTMADGQMVESACVGHEGMLGIGAFLGDAPTPYQTLLQVGDGLAARMGLAPFRRELLRGGAMHRVIGRYAHALVSAMMQSGACNRLHHVRQRCSRWLLEAHDRIHGDEFNLSHEFLAVMLGTHRPTVTLVAGSLQKAGLIRYRHGRVTIIDRPGLEQESCECYATIRRYFAQLSTAR